MSTLQELEQPIDEAIVRLVIELIPESWKSAVLTVSQSIHGVGPFDFAHSIKSPEGHRDIVFPTDELFQSTLQLGELFTSYGKLWKQAVYTVHKLPDGDLDYEVEFAY